MLPMVSEAILSVTEVVLVPEMLPKLSEPEPTLWWWEECWRVTTRAEERSRSKIMEPRSNYSMECPQQQPWRSIQEVSQNTGWTYTLGVCIWYKYYLEQVKVKLLRFPTVEMLMRPSSMFWEASDLLVPILELANWRRCPRGQPSSELVSSWMKSSVEVNIPFYKLLSFSLEHIQL